MDNEAIFNQFDEIEQRVVRLLSVCKSLEAANFEQKKRIETLENELSIKAEIEKEYTEEKRLIRTRIDELLSKLENVNELSE